MAQAISDTLPIDAGSQKFVGPVDPADGQFALLWAVAAQTFSSKEYAALGVLPVWKTDRTHDGLTVDTTAVKRGTSGSSTAGVDARGFNQCAAFITISGIDANTVDISVVPRFTQTGDDFAPETVILNDEDADGSYFVTFDVNSPYFMIAAVASSGSVTVTVDLYLHRI